jgi:hypothetical protein
LRFEKVAWPDKHEKNAKIFGILRSVRKFVRICKMIKI